MTIEIQGELMTRRTPHLHAASNQREHPYAAGTFWRKVQTEIRVHIHESHDLLHRSVYIIICMIK